MPMYEHEFVGENPIRTNPYHADVGNVASLKHLTPDVQARKLTEVRNGASLLEGLPPFPDSRPCQDCFWAFLFVLSVGGTMALSYAYAGSALAAVADAAASATTTVGPTIITDDPKRAMSAMRSVGSLIAPGIAGTAASLVAANFFMIMARCNATCVVYVALLLTPLIMIAQGLTFCLFIDKNPLMGVAGMLLVFLGLCSLTCVCCCWRALIPFTAAVVQTVADVAEHHPCMIIVSLLGSVASAVMTMVCCVALFGAQRQMQKETTTQDSSAPSLLTIMISLCLFWFGGVICNVCHCVYCGIFGRWYFGKDGPMVLPSIWVACTTSLGSICFGSLLVAAVNLLEALARGARQNAQEEGNIVCCIVMCCFECVLSCIGDILEYFNDWAYVQCAIRGASYCQAARITNTLCTCSNVRFVYTDLLIGSVTMLGSLLCALVGAAVGAGVGYASGLVGERAMMAGIGGLLGFVGGLFAGSSAMSLIPSGTKTILSCWAEDPTPLQEHNPEVHRMFCQRIHAAMAG